MPHRVVTLPNGDKKQDERSSVYVPWKLFIWAMAVVLIIFGWTLGSVNTLAGKVSNVKDSFSSVQVDIQELKTNVIWIVNTLKRDNR